MLLKELELNQRNKMTEKDYNPEQRNAKAMKKQETAKIANASVNKAPETKKAEEEKAEEKKTEDKKEVEKKETKKQPQKVVKKDEAIVKGISVPISTKYSVAICNFIKRKPLEKAIKELEEVLKLKRAIPMKGEIPHRKGKIMSGRYPIKATQNFLKMLRNLLANSNVNGVENPIIVEAISNKATRPYGRFGSIKRKRTHVTIKVMEKKKKGGKK